jgi:hypothetical protein
VELHARPYFEIKWDEVVKQKAQEAEAVANNKVAESQAQLEAARAAKAKAKADSDAAARAQDEARQEVAKAQRSGQDLKAKAALAERKATAQAEEMVRAQRAADEQLARAMEAQAAAQALQDSARREQAALSAPLRATTRDLPRGCEPWTAIEARVQQSMPQHVVTRLQQIDNNELLMDFNRQKEIAAAKPANIHRGDTIDKRANVRFAFHAMAGGPDELKKIYEGGREEGGFDLRLARGRLVGGRMVGGIMVGGAMVGGQIVGGTIMAGAYGRGSYFAEHAIYSAYMFPCPDKAPDGSITLLVADVILGESKDFGSAVDGTLVREPPIAGGAAGDVYDSVQGTENGFGVHGPTHRPRPDARRYGGVAAGCEEYGRQYVVYKKEKAYPRYLVTIRPR